MTRAACRRSCTGWAVPRATMRDETELVETVVNWVDVVAGVDRRPSPPPGE